MDLNKQIKQSKDRNEKYQDNFGDDVSVHVPKDVASEYSIFGLLFQEIAQIRIEVDRFGLVVRMNISESPNYLKPYVSQLQTLLLIVNPVIPSTTYDKIQKLYERCCVEIETFNQQRKGIPNKKIPESLIKKLDLLCRIVYLYMNRANLGIKTSQNIDLESQIEKSIVGD